MMSPASCQCGISKQELMSTTETLTRIDGGVACHKVGMTFWLRTFGRALAPCALLMVS